MNLISAKIIADSVTEQGHRLTTFILVMPRIILAEFNTHRMISRNSASSRAIPFEKMVKSVQETPFIPIKWMKEHKGMQGTEFITELSHVAMKNKQWLHARDTACTAAWNLYNPYTSVDIQEEIPSITKQMCNRLLEPFMYHTVIATASEWGNFFALRAHPDAEIHMQDLAYKMLDAYNQSEPKKLAAGEWHIPFGDNINDGQLAEAGSPAAALRYTGNSLQMLKVKVATARCARVSYTEVGVSLEGTNYENDIKLHDRLLAAGHMSPFEHCARAMSHEEYETHCNGELNDYTSTMEGFYPTESSEGWSGNFRGFIQYRKMIPNENRTDSRVKPHERTD